MLKKHQINPIFIRSNLFDIKKVSGSSYFYTNLSYISSLDSARRHCLVGKKSSSFRRTKSKFSCSFSGIFGRKIGPFLYNRFVLLKKMTFNSISCLPKRSW